MMRLFIDARTNPRRGREREPTSAAHDEQACLLLLAGGRTYFRIRLRPERSNAINFGASHFDVRLANRVGDDLNIVSHINERVGDFANTGSGTVIRGKRTGRNHCNVIASLICVLMRYAPAIRYNQAPADVLPLLTVPRRYNRYLGRKHLKSRLFG